MSEPKNETTEADTQLTVNGEGIALEGDEAGGVLLAECDAREKEASE